MDCLARDFRHVAHDKEDDVGPLGHFNRLRDARGIFRGIGEAR